MVKESLLILENVKKYYPIVKGLVFSRITELVKAVDGIDAVILKGETFGLVGESGCGKSTLARQILRLEDPTDGRILYNGNNILTMNRKEVQQLRRRMQIIFQDPYSSLNPRKTAGQIIMDPLLIHKQGKKSKLREKVLYLMGEVGLSPEHFTRYPHEFSGGQRQRISIARALALNAEFIICDEPVSALDVSIQAQVINLLISLQEKHSLTYLFISHDLNLVKHISDHIAVMYLGRFVEVSSNYNLNRNPLHPYTIGLMSATPIANPRLKRERNVLKGEVASPTNPPRGCHFHPRCPRASDICREEIPKLQEIKTDHWVRCFSVNGMT